MIELSKVNLHSLLIDFSVSLIPSFITGCRYFYQLYLIMFNHTRKVRKKDIW